MRGIVLARTIKQLHSLPDTCGKPPPPRLAAHFSPVHAILVGVLSYEVELNYTTGHKSLGLLLHTATPNRSNVSAHEFAHLGSGAAIVVRFC